MTGREDGPDTARAASFEVGGAEYERFRPGFPLEVVSLLLRHRAGGAPGAGLGDVLDLGAGTGKLTEILAPHATSVLAVDPSASMLGALGAKELPGVTLAPGAAERIPAPTGSVDVVTVAQAFHWFDRGPACAEMARVLRPDGLLALLWNTPAPESPWDADAHAWIHEAAEAPEPAWPTPVEQAASLAAALADLPGLTVIDSACLEWTETLSSADYLSRWRTVSAYLVADVAERARMEAGVDEILDRSRQTRDAERLELHQRTAVVLLRPTQGA